MDLFYGTSGPRDAHIAIVAESWGREEEKKQQPLVGVSGQLNDVILAECGLRRNDVFCTNVISAHPADNDMCEYFYPTQEAKAGKLKDTFGLYPREILIKEMERLYEQLSTVNPRVIIAYGNYALWALCYGIAKIKNDRGYKVPAGIMSWRGSLLAWDRSFRGNHPKTPVIPTIHPAAVQRQWHLKWLVQTDIKKRVLYIAKGHKPEEPYYDFTLRPSFGDTVAWINNAISAGTKRWAVDIETRKNHLACLCLAISEHRAICIPFMCVEHPEGYFLPEQEHIVCQMLRFIFTNPDYEIVGQFFGYDMQYISKFLLCRPRCYFDTFVGHHLCWPGTPGGLAFLASIYNRYYRYWKDEGKEWDIHLPQEQWWRYNCIDGVNTWEASYRIEEQIRRCPRKQALADGSTQTIFVDLTDRLREQMEVFHLQFEMMQFGIAIDKRARAEMLLEVWLEMCDMEVWFEAVMPSDIAQRIKTKTGKSEWYSSQKQLCNFFYGELGIDPVTNRDTGAPRMDDDALQRIKVKLPVLRELCTKLQNYRSLSIFRGNFLTARLDRDGRMRCLFTQLPATFRWSSKENAFGGGTNLQTIPKG